MPKRTAGVRTKRPPTVRKPTRRRSTTIASTDTPAATVQPMTDEPLIGPADVALMLGVPTSWVYTKSEAGTLPSYKLGHYRRFKRIEIEDYLRRCRSTGQHAD